MSAILPALPKDWIHRIFTRFKIVYGPALMAGTWGDELEEVVIGWAEELAGFREHPEAIKYALQNLPKDYPPNLLQFKEICRDGMKHMNNSYTSLPHKLTDEEKAQNLRNLEKIKELVGLKVVQ